MNLIGLADKSRTLEIYSLSSIRRGNGSYVLEVELRLSPDTTFEEGDSIILRLPSGKVFNRKEYPLLHSVEYRILFATKEDAEQTKKVFRRLQRGRPRFKIAFVNIYRLYGSKK